MDNLDALLNELHETNVEILKRNQPDALPPDRTRQDWPRALETEIDPVPSPLDSGHSSFSRGWLHSDPEQNSSTEQQPFGKQPNDQSELLSGFDQGDYAYLENSGPNDAHTDFTTQRTSSSNKSALGHSSSSKPLSSDVWQQETSGAAAHKAAQQLDDLLVSLDQFQLNSNPQSSASTAPPPPSSSYQNPAAKSVQPLSCNGAASSRVPLNGQLLSDNSRGNRAVSLENVNFSEEPASVQGPAILSNMLSDLSNELSEQGAVTSAKGSCYACQKPVVGKLISALGQFWHPDHFTCSGCGIGLVRKDFYERDQQPYCLDCHMQLFSPKCSYCNEAILEKCISAMGKTWHPGHFFCHHCQQAFGGNATVHEFDNGFYCSSCYMGQFGTRCYGCSQPITDTYITALNAPWHRECFVCSHFESAPFELDEYDANNGSRHYTLQMNELLELHSTSNAKQIILDFHVSDPILSLLERCLRLTNFPEKLKQSVQPVIEKKSIIPFQLLFDCHTWLKNEVKICDPFWKVFSSTYVVLPKPEQPLRNQELDKRVTLLKEKFATMDYNRMVADVGPKLSVPSSSGQEGASFCSEFRCMNKQLIMVLNFMLIVSAGFIFGYFIPDLISSTTEASVAVRLMCALSVSLVIFFADLYFLMKNASKVEKVYHY